MNGCKEEDCLTEDSEFLNLGPMINQRSRLISSSSIELVVWWFSVDCSFLSRGTILNCQEDISNLDMDWKSVGGANETLDCASYYKFTPNLLQIYCRCWTIFFYNIIILKRLHLIFYLYFTIESILVQSI